MAACIDNSTTNHVMHLAGNSPRCQRSTSLCRLSCLNPENQIDYGAKLMDFNRLNLQECNEDHDQMWLKIRREAEFDVNHEPILSKYYHHTILMHFSLERALAHHLSVKLCDANVSRDDLYDAFLKVLDSEREIRRAIRKDLEAVRERDPACVSYVHCFLNFKGFLACQAYRLAHDFWVKGRSVLAFYIQNRVSEVFGMDIHPGAKIGHGVVFDHGTGVVIGETAVIGNDVTILHSVTLGGTGKVQGDRHPKIGDGVLIGAGAMVLGNVRVGENAKIGAGSVVLNEVPARATAVGNPARVARFR